ncbi:MAG: hypothetical protein ABII26_06110 [Pseudomonadota bacterium]
MATERDVERFFAIFDVKIHKALGLNEKISKRVMLNYDRKENRKDFKVLSKEKTGGVNNRIELWLKENKDIHELMHKLNRDEIDMDHYQKTYHC